MRKLSRESWINSVLVLLLALAPLCASLLDEPYYVSLASRVVIIAMAAVGLNLALGFGGLISFGHAAFFGLGGYVAGVAAYHAFDGSYFIGGIPGSDQMPVIWLVAVLVAGLAAAFIGVISLRTQGVYFIMITLAFAQMIYYFAISFPTYGGEDGLSIYVRNSLFSLDTSDPLIFFGICFFSLMLSIFFTRRLMGSRFGAALTMARLNEVRLATSGVEPFPIRLTAFVLSAMITSGAGALFADLNGFVSPSMLSWHHSGELMVIVILGGVGRLFGPVAGAVVFVLLETFIGGFTQHWQFFLGLILLSVVLFANGGLIGLLAGRSRHD
ncbi:branched-chain amino acid ABC transporter permease [Kiloniella laminariae]|uniref:branched-chain amino acid ABC transporter permease n=1 Tax=Kiloniella laminariae TaxID=454162 RepID=UPI00037DEA3F|nr:branched-chain amino acid ABC transporter permease [Kiloniella laminariae]